MHVSGSVKILAEQQPTTILRQVWGMIVEFGVCVPTFELMDMSVFVKVCTCGSLSLPMCVCAAMSNFGDQSYTE